jgi:hypothetical protein
MICPNCKNQLSCGCQKKVASNGTSVCANCIASYEIHLAATKTKNTVVNNPETARMRQETKPTDVNATGTLG